jgi:hypothetical protein
MREFRCPADRMNADHDIQSHLSFRKVCSIIRLLSPSLSTLTSHFIRSSLYPFLSNTSLQYRRSRLRLTLLQDGTAGVAQSSLPVPNPSPNNPKSLLPLPPTLAHSHPLKPSAREINLSPALPTPPLPLQHLQPVQAVQISTSVGVHTTPLLILLILPTPLLSSFNQTNVLRMHAYVDCSFL